MTPYASPSNASRTKQLAALASTATSLVLTLAKFAAGLASGSLALVSEGAHNAIDIAISATTFFAVRVSDKPADENHPFGHAKIEAVAALAQTGFLFALSIAILYTATERLIAGHVAIDANVWAFAVIVVSIVVDAVRWRLLAWVARETKSDAIAADALHYSADLVASGLVLIGLAASRLGFVYGDAVAALGVAVYIGFAGFRLGRRTIDALVDAAPKGLMAKVRAFAETATGIAGVAFLRLRHAGPEIVGDLGVYVSRTLPLDRVSAIKANLAEALVARWPELRVTIIANPVALDDETILERVQLIAARRRLFVHHVAVQQVDGRASITLDLEVEGRMGLGAAHAIATRLEDAIRGEFGAATEVETHIEPLETRELAGADAAPEATQRLADTLRRLAAEDGGLIDIHDVRLRVAEGVGYGLFHCRVAPETPVAEAHARVDALERAAKRELRELIRVTGHVEPAETSETERD